MCGPCGGCFQERYNQTAHCQRGRKTGTGVGMEDLATVDQCKTGRAASDRGTEGIPGIEGELVLSCSTGDCFDRISSEPLPLREATMGVIKKTRPILCPGAFMRLRVNIIHLSGYFGQEATALFEALTEQITPSILHECLRCSQPYTHCEHSAA